MNPIQFVRYVILILMCLSSACSLSDDLPNGFVINTPVTSVIQPNHPNLNVLIASTDIAVGSNRFVFGLLDADFNAVRTMEVSTLFLYLKEDFSGVRQTIEAHFVEWPSSSSGVYVIDEVFYEDPGDWMVVVSANIDGISYSGQAEFVVKVSSSSPPIGGLAPKTQNKTVNSVSGLKEITSSKIPDLGLYQISVANAIKNDMPTVVTFASPAYCQTSTCGPQVAILSKVKDDYIGRVNFIHIEVYENHNDISGDFSKAKISPHLEEWGILTEPFTFLIDREGRISKKFEGFVSNVELSDALTVMLN